MSTRAWGWRAAQPGNPAACCFVPPYIFEKLVDSSTPEVRELGLRNLLWLADDQATRLAADTLDDTKRRSGRKAGEKHRKIYDARSDKYWPGHNMLKYYSPPLVMEEGGPPAADPAVTNIYDMLGIAYDFFWIVFKRDSYDNQGAPLIASVHCFHQDKTGKAVPWANAAWMGGTFGFGAIGEQPTLVDSGFTDFTCALDVVGHEFTHAVVQHTAHFVHRGQPGAMNEHFGDVFGSLVKQWHFQQMPCDADWLLGAEVVKSRSTCMAMRNMARPGHAYWQDPYWGDDPQPDNYDNMWIVQDGRESEANDYGYVHHNCGILNKAFHCVATGLPGYAWQDTGDIWWHALNKLRRRSTFRELATVTREYAWKKWGKAYYQVVDDAWSQVGLQRGRNGF